MITNYIPNTCGYGLNNLKKVVHIFSESANVIHIDNGEAYVTSGITDLQTISATSVSFEETTAYYDRFKFQKTVTATVNGFAKLSALGGKYYVVLEDVNGIMWLVNADFPSLVTYTYTLQDGTDETVFTFSALSNFPTLKLNASINNAYTCQNYSLVRVDEIKMLEKRYANINASTGIVYGYSSQVYKTVRPYRNSIKVEESFDGTNANTTIQFSIGLDDYQSSWHYNMLEYPYNKYVAVIDHLACGFEMGLVPSYNVQGSHQIGGGDTVTVTLVGGSQRGSEWAESWMEVTVAPVYTWKMTNDWICAPTEYRWVTSTDPNEWTCSSYNKVYKSFEEVKVYGSDWRRTGNWTASSDVIEYNSDDCGFQSPLYFQANAPSTVTFRKSDLYASKTVVYSLDNGVTWNTLSSAKGTTISLSTGDKMCVKGDATTQAYAGSVFRIYGDVYVGGNIMSLLYPDTYTEELDLPPRQSTYATSIAFYELFGGSTGITSCSYKLLPATGLTNECYRGMFAGCTNLTTVPELPATTLANGCYYNMFYACTSLTSLPSDLLPATTLGNDCYNGMFSGCTSLTAAPVLSATTLASGCYYSMFNGCTSLTATPQLPATTLADECYRAMFGGCVSLSASTDFSNVTSVGSGSCTSMFAGCTGITSIPSLIVGGKYMFSGCISLTEIPVVRHGYAYMFRGCTALTSAIINGISGGGHMFEGCTSLTGVTGTVYPGGKSGCTAMFSGCTALTVAPELPGTTLYDGCYKDMFAYCTSLTTAPDLPATYAIYKGDRIPDALRPTYYETDCYERMFYGCSSLNYVKCLVTNIAHWGGIAFHAWLYGVSPTGTFVRSAIGGWTRDDDGYGIPENWTVQNAT